MSFLRKPYIKSPINYMGSKYDMVGHLLDIFPKAETFVDLFTGSGTVYMNVAHLYEKIIVNDSLSQIIEIHKNLHDKDWVSVAINRSIKTIQDENEYKQLRDEYNLTRDPRLLLALIWSCNSNMMRFNSLGEFNQTWGQRGFNQEKSKIYNKFISSIRNDHVDFVSMSFDDVDFPDDSFVYMDPPYSNTGAGYNLQWKESDDIKLIEYVNELNSRGVRFCLSGVVNEKDNFVYNYLKDVYNVKFYGDLYSGIAKVQRTNNEYLIYNF